jgi:hypothetical protein
METPTKAPEALNQAASNEVTGCGCLFGLLLFFVYCLVDLILVWFTVLPGWRARLFGTQTQGTVISVDQCSSDSDVSDMLLRISRPGVDIQYNVQPTIRFTDRQGRTYQAVDHLCGNYGIGETVTLWYLLSDPSTISLEDDTGGLLMATIIALIVTICAGGVLAGWFGFLLARLGKAVTGSPPPMSYG